MSIDRTDILLVEDNMDDAELTKRALQKINLAYSLIHVKNGEEALNFIFCAGPYVNRNILDCPRFILLDLKMPKISGLEVLQKIKSDERVKSIPTVVFTSSKESNDILACYNLGANSYVVKPVDFEEFVTVVSTIGFYWLQLNQPSF